ncbi:MAG TPA: hypothetical protein PL182_00135 [Pseudobdellovibrionaceae bacterium]|nr:hypothetical protein [Pseudobdellovibrionaceae bacterium]
MKNLVLAAVLGVIIYGSTLIYQYRDVVFYWDFAKSVGEIQLEHNEKLEQAVDLFLVENASGGHGQCVHQWFGRDDLYLYVKILCDQFVKEDGLVKAQGGTSFQPARLEYDPTTDTVQTMEIGDMNDFASLRKLFPKQVYSLMKWGAEPSHDLLEKGYERQQRENLAPEDHPPVTE